MTFPDKGKQLYLGEGDFSLTRSLCEHHNLPKDAVVTCYAKDLTDEVAKNFKYLESSGITVLTDIDATKLETYQDISKYQYDFIIFNFPHTGHKMKIHLCRTLLREFLCSAAPLLSDNGQIWVTLCAGQGGTAGETVRRAWSDSWQLTVQAAAAGLVLRRLLPFRPEAFPGYRPTGNRGSQSRGFHTGSGVIHVLVRGRSLSPDTLPSRLAVGGHRLVLGDTPLPLADYWLRRLRPAGDTLAELILRRLAARAAPGAPLRRQLLVRRDGRAFRAGQAALDDYTAGGDLICLFVDDDGVRGDNQGDGAGSSGDIDGDGGGNVGGSEAASTGTRVTYTVVDGEVSREVAAAPLRTELRVAAPAEAAPDPRNVLTAFGLACKETRQGDASELRAGCGGASVHVAAVRTEGGGATARVVTTFDVDAVAACWAGDDDWRHAVRSDFRADGASLLLDSVHPPAYTLDMSFWVAGGAEVEEPFSWERLRRALRAVLGEQLVRLELLDEYEQPGSGRRACTVRVEYQDLSGPLSYETARRLHVEVLPEVLRQALGVDGR